MPLAKPPLKAVNMMDTTTTTTEVHLAKHLAKHLANHLANPVWNSDPEVWKDQHLANPVWNSDPEVWKDHQVTEKEMRLGLVKVGLPHPLAPQALALPALPYPLGYLTQHLANPVWNSDPEVWKGVRQAVTLAMVTTVTLAMATTTATKVLALPALGGCKQHIFTMPTCRIHQSAEGCCCNPQNANYCPFHQPGKIP